MEQAIEQARKCEPKDRERTPLVGAVIVKNGHILAEGWRQTDIHAEKDALEKVTDPNALADATVYTTLEPCTPEVRSKPEQACTNLLLDAHLKKVVIGILDPNQQVCGKGVLELQRHGIEVELFPHDLALEVRRLNADFIRAQRTLGVQFIGTPNGAELPMGKHTFRCKCLNEPGPDIFVLVERSGRWWPQVDRLRQHGSDEYVFDWNSGSTGTHTVHIVRANELGIALVTYYRAIVNRNKELRSAVEANTALRDVRAILNNYSDYPGILMPKLPKGLDSQGSVSVEVISPPLPA
jgi:pyrimidine deaminase RibD-like protein